MDINNHFDIIT